MEKEFNKYVLNEIDSLIEQWDEHRLSLDLFKKSYSLVSSIMGDEWANEHLLAKYGFLTGLDDFWYIYIRNKEDKGKLGHMDVHKVIGSFCGALRGIQMKMVKDKDDDEFKVQLKKELKEELKSELKEELLKVIYESIKKTINKTV